MEEYERQNGQLPGHDKVRGWLSDALCYPTLPAAPRLMFGSGGFSKRARKNDSERAGRTTVTRASESICETYYGHAE